MPKTNFDAIKSRIQEASKAKQKRFEERIIERKSQPLQDVDLRAGASTTKPMDVDETSQEALDSSIQIIMAQAQEQLDNQAITPDQYQSMVQQVIQLNESNKIKEAERMEKRTNGETVEVGSSTESSDSEEDVRRRRAGERRKKSRFQDRSPGDRGPHPPFMMNNGMNMGGGLHDPRRGDPRRNQPWEHNNNNNNMNMQRPNWRGGMPPGQFNNRNPWNNNNGGGRFNGPPRFNNNNNNRMMPPFGGPPMMPPLLLNQPQQPPLIQMGNQMIGGGNINNPPENQSTIKIDNVNREIRYYDDVAIVFMDWDQPKEIGFQPGTRRISCDDQWSMNLSFNAPNVTWMIEGRAHQVRLGAPTRELYIDNEWYECYVGDPCRIELDGKVRTLMIDGPPPQVRIGEMRRDLVAGKISIIIDAKMMVPVYLDAREQQFEVDGHVQTLQFADYFSTVLINKEPISVEFGGLPRSFFVHGQKHFMRFTALPAGVVPGQCFVQGMTRTSEKRHLPSPPPPHLQQLNLMMSHPPPPMLIPPPAMPPPPAASKLTNGLDMLTNILPGLASPGIPLLGMGGGGGHEQQQPQTMGYNLENNGQAANSNAAASSNPLGGLNVNDLFQKLLATGILAKTPAQLAASKEGEAKKEESNAAEEGEKNSSQLQSSSSQQAKGRNNNNHNNNNQRGRGHQNNNHRGGKQEENKTAVPPPVPLKVNPVDLTNPTTIKTRQLAIVQQVYFGMQCSSCGVRFPPEQTMKYSQHLDWHYRQNRRDKDSVRKAHSRKWFYDVNNWIQYEEIEDLEEREKNWFETQQTAGEGGQEEGGTNAHGADNAMPSCPAGPTEGEKICEVCHEAFEQFYCEDTEEWHLRPAVRVEERVYHPICYEDYKLSLTLDESKMDATASQEESQEEDVAAAEVKTEVKSEEKNSK